MTSIITFTDVAKIVLVAYVFGFISFPAFVLLFGKKKKIPPAPTDETGVLCTCDVGVTEYVARGANCAYHRMGCPAREYWNTTRG